MRLRHRCDTEARIKPHASTSDSTILLSPSLPPLTYPLSLSLPLSLLLLTHSLFPTLNGVSLIELQSPFVLGRFYDATLSERKAGGQLDGECRTVRRCWSKTAPQGREGERGRLEETERRARGGICGGKERECGRKERVEERERGKTIEKETSGRGRRRVR